MSEHVYKIVEVVGSSAECMDQAVKNAIKEASQELRHLRWFQVTDTRGHLEDGAIAHWQVTVKIGFTKDANN